MSVFCVGVCAFRDVFVLSCSFKSAVHREVMKNDLTS
jgi:hypothetical protein